ncbi:MAG: PGF-pre-PGF domain-containing protein [Archaeoglobaceae archaeon]|nr:PGF-pre-PGF domain-containing protein [Archaeoglobaceae archaeon]MDW8117536.1 PGF-pre-PGF domain-containing protein [Archaeoglobaceae archaeon]
MRNSIFLLLLVIALTSICNAQSFCEANDFVCAIRSSPSTFAGINVTKIHVWDFYNSSIANYQFYGASIIQIPQISNIERNLIPGSKAQYTVYTTPRTNQTLTSFANTFAVYNENMELDVNINIASQGLPLVLKLKNDKIEEYISNYPDSIQGMSFEKLMDMVEYAFAFNNSGWAKVKYNDKSKRFEVEGSCSFNLGSNIIQTIQMNSINLQNFRLNNSTITCGLPQNLKQMEPGYYFIAVLSVNNYGNPTFKLFVPFVVLSGRAQGNKPSVSNVTIGDDIKLNFSYEFNASFAILVKDVAYTASFKMNLKKPISNSFEVNLTYGNEPLTEIKVLGKDLNFYAPAKLVRAVFNNSENQQMISTKNLETGSYSLYVITFGDQLEPKYFGKLSVSILQPTPPTTTPPTTPTTTPTTPPAPRPIVGGGGGGGGGGVIPGVPIYVSDYIKLKANEENEFIMPQSAFWETNLVSIIFIPAEDINLRFRAEKLKEWPEIPRPPWGIVAYVFTIHLTLSAPTEIRGYITYGVERDFIKENLFDPDGVIVVLQIFDGENWIRCETTYVGTDGKYNYYKASVPTFSGYFATVIEALPPTVTPPEIVAEKPPETPATTPALPVGFELYLGIFLLVAIGAILAMIAYILWRTK